MRLKFTYLGDLMMAMDKFENHGNVNDMKEFLLKVYKIVLLIWFFVIRITSTSITWLNRFIKKRQ